MAKDLVADVLLPALEDSELSKAAREAASQLSHFDVHKFPLGFTTGGKTHSLPALLPHDTTGSALYKVCYGL